MLSLRGCTRFGRCFVPLCATPNRRGIISDLLAQKYIISDLLAQKYDALHGDGQFIYQYEIAYLYFNPFDEISVRYYGIQVNTEFDVVFPCVNDEFLLKRFISFFHKQP